MDDADTYIDYVEIEEMFGYFEGDADSRQQRALECVAAIEEGSFADCWSAEEIKDTLQYDYNKLLIAKHIDGNITEVVGYLIYNEIEDTTELLRIAVDENHRGRHIGKMLMDSYISLASGKCEHALLEVRSTNVAARRLYETKGYEQLTIRKKYYRNPEDDAVIYQKKLS